jgi:hypothetical protein
VKQIEFPPDISPGLDDPERRLGHDGKVNPSIHALHHTDLGRMFSTVSLTLGPFPDKLTRAIFIELK